MPGLAPGLGRLRGRGVPTAEGEVVHTKPLARLPKQYRRLARVDNFLKFCDESKQRRAVVACGKDWRAALALLQGIDKASVRLHVLGFNAAMRTCELAGRWFSAVSLCEQMQHLGIRPNKFVHDVLVKACGISGRWSGGVQILSTMCTSAEDDKGFEAPDHVTFNCAISGCTGDAWHVAIGLFSGLFKFSVQPSHVTYSASSSLDGGHGPPGAAARATDRGRRHRGL